MLLFHSPLQNLLATQSIVASRFGYYTGEYIANMADKPIPRSPPLNTGYSNEPVKRPFSDNAVVTELWAIQEMDRIASCASAYHAAYIALEQLRKAEHAYFKNKRHWSTEKRQRRKKELQDLALHYDMQKRLVAQIIQQ